MKIITLTTKKPSKKFEEVKKALNISSEILEIASEKKPEKNTYLEAPENLRHIVEKNKNIFVYNLEQEKKKDQLHQRRSGLDHIICQLAKKNNITIAFNFTTILEETDPKKRAQVIGRISQNIQLCKKFSVKTQFVQITDNHLLLRNPKDIESFFTTIN